MRIGINGFGRIGRQAFRIAWEDPELEVVHVNDVTGAEALAYLLKYDSTYGVWAEEVRAEEGALVVKDRQIPVTSERDPTRLPWSEGEVEVVLEASGVFRRREEAEAHIEAVAERVLITAPGKSPLDGDFVVGVNDEDYVPDEHRIISIGSCTTNCLATVVHVLHREFELRRGFMSTVHAYTNDQHLLDGPHKDFRRGRSAAANVVPTSTGASTAIASVFPELEGKIDGVALRVPVACGSLLDLTCEIEKGASAEELNEAFRRAAGERLAQVLEVADAPIVSSDIVKNPHSAIVDPEETRSLGETLVKVLAWYDNEWAFSCRLIDMLRRMAR